MIPRPPIGSTISVAEIGSNVTIVIPQANSGIARFGICLFLLCWLGGWAFGMHFAISDLLAGKGGLFLMFWLGGWTLGGAFAAYYVYLLLRPCAPETFGLTRRSVLYDSGVPPFDFKSVSESSNAAWSSYFPKRTRAEIDLKQLQSLCLRQTDSGNRLTIDSGATRLDLARGATEVEREWLYRVLAQRFSLEPATSFAPGAEPAAG